MTRKKAPGARFTRLAAAPAAGLSVLAAGAGASAETTISTAVTTPVATSSARSGQPDDLTISADGSVKPSSGVAVTLDSDNKLTNAGTIQITGANNATGVLIVGGHTGTFTNQNLVQVDETVVTKDADGDGDPDGPFVTGSNRFGVRLAGPGAFTGDIVQSTAGGVVVKGNDSVAMSIESALNGSIRSQGSLSTLGDRTVALRITAPVSGDVALLGSISAQGAAAQGVVVGADVGGRVVLQNGLTATGYRSTTRSTVQSVLNALDSDDLLQGGSAVTIAGNVGRGVLVDTPPTLSSTNTDVDGDGIPDTAEGTGTIAAFGRAPAMVVGAAGRGVTLGNVGTGDDAYGLVIRGSVTGSGVYDGVDSTALQIGVANGGLADLSGGVRVQGTITSSAFKADTTGVHLLAGARVPTLWVQGTIDSGLTGETGSTARAVAVESGAVLTDLANAGTIKATVIGSSGKAVAVQDLSGSIRSVANLGVISAVGSPVDSSLKNQVKLIALDLSANTAGVSIHQAGLTSDSKPAIIGQVLLGSGNDSIVLDQGTLTGDIAFGAGANLLSINGGSSVVGGLTATGGTVALSVGTGSLSVKSSAPLALTTLDLGSGSSLILAADPEAGTHAELDVAGTANVATGAKIGVSFQSLLKGQATYVLVKAARLNSGGVDTSLLGQVPYLYRAALRTDPAAGVISIELARKTAAELGLSAQVSGAYEPLVEAIDRDATVRDAFLTQTTRAGLMKAYNQLLPNYSGSVFEAVASSVDATARAIDDRQGSGAGGAWLQETNVYGRRDGSADLPGYKISGFNLVGGYEFADRGLGAWGATFAGGSLEVKDDGASAAETLSVNRAEAGGYWRWVHGPLSINARLAATYLDVSSHRAIFIRDDADNLVAQKTADATWNGWGVNGRVSAAYEGHIGGAYARPVAAIDYLRLEEGGYTERNGGDAVDLHVSARQSSRSTGFAGLVTGTRFGDQDSWWGPEVTLGYREIGAAQVASTTAQFASGGDSFRLLADQVKGGGVVARVGVKGEIPGGAFAVEGGAENRDSLNIYDLRLAAHFQF